MKFNFEKIKDNAKKNIMGAGVIIASVGNLEAQEIKPSIVEKKLDKTEVFNNTLKETAKKDTIQERIISDQQRIKEIEKDLGISKKNSINNPEYYRSKYLKYMEHPSYKERLAKEMYGDALINEEMKKNIDEEYAERLKQIKKILIEINPNINKENDDYSNYNPETNKIETKEDVIFHEISHSLDANFRPIKNLEEFRPARDKGFTFKKREILSSAKERSILENRKDSLTLKNPNDPYINWINRSIHYLSQNTELKARLNYLRMKAIENYNFDLNKDFNVNDFDELKKDAQYIDLKEGLGLSDEQINELMKYTADIGKNINNNEGYFSPDWNYGNEDNQA